MKIAAITCAYNEDKFLPIWLDYYTRELGSENLYVVDDGSNVPIHSFFPNALRVPRAEHFSAFRPWQLATGMQNLLFSLGYEVVIFADVDEFIIPCREQYQGLQHFFHENKADVYTTVGLEIPQNLNSESSLDWTKPIFQQRRYCRFSTTYCKSQITRKPWDWVNHLHLTTVAPPPHPKLFNCHLKLVDFDYACMKLRDNQNHRFVEQEVLHGLNGHWRFTHKQLFDTNYKSFLSKPVDPSWNFDIEISHCQKVLSNDGGFDLAQPLKILPDFFEKTGV